jgi:hypothetical protein
MAIQTRRREFIITLGSRLISTRAKVFGMVPLTFLFAALQYPLLRRAREGGRAIVMD